MFMCNEMFFNILTLQLKGCSYYMFLHVDKEL